MFYTESNNISSILLILDFEQTFDSINYSLIDESLNFNAFYFEPLFRRIITNLYTDISSRVINNVLPYNLNHIITFLFQFIQPRVQVELH